MRNGSVTLIENKGNVFSHKTKSNRTILPPLRSTTGIFPAVSPPENENRKPADRSAVSSQGLRNTSDGTVHRRGVLQLPFSSDRPSAAVQKTVKGFGPRDILRRRVRCIFYLRPIRRPRKTVLYRKHQAVFRSDRSGLFFQGGGTGNSFHLSISATFDRSYRCVRQSPYPAAP